ncbi:MAG: orotidine-5'-phosphate decarboxylase [Saprospiraceae bacterium]|nr:orotidine-5'-phosphate decarboxylase [Saprospiraceae bacterium]
MDKAGLWKQIRQKSSMLCVGLDSDESKMPEYFQLTTHPQIVFNKAIIEATKDLAVAYKLNTAFYETRGAKGWHAMEETLLDIPDNCLKIADAKRGDIGNTSTMYAKAFFEQLEFDAMTIAPYMGIDSVKPFLEFQGKWVIILAVTSNEGSKNFQFQELKSGLKLFEEVLNTTSKWGTDSQIMYVVGATHPEFLGTIRSIVPEHFLLVPGVGAQGGDLKAVLKNGITGSGGLLINSSRGILFAGKGEDAIPAARREAQRLQQLMAPFIR